jgi:hypothetical protein
MLTAFSSPCIDEPIFWQPIFSVTWLFPQASACDVAWFLLYANAVSDFGLLLMLKQMRLGLMILQVLSLLH